MQIESIHNPRVKLWTQLLDKKGRDKQGKFVIEGIHLVKEALLGGMPTECIVYRASEGIPEELRAVAESGAAEWIGVSDAVLEKCTATETPQGVFAVLPKLRWNEQSLLGKSDALVVVADGVQDPGNVGTIIRCADAVGATGVVLGKGTADLYNPKTVRATMGSLFHLPIVEHDTVDMLSKALDHGMQLVVTSLQAERNCYELDMRAGTWIILGNEARGVSSEVMAMADRHVIIPMSGSAESLNVAMAGTVLLFEAQRQRRYSP